ncbi:MAG: 50S ribosomal protein L17 [Bacteroidota bacterium]
MLERKLGRRSGGRRALLRAVVTALFKHGRITTTEIKAKEIRSYAEHLITLAKRGDLHARRLVAAELDEPGTVQKLFGEIAPKYAARAGGYTRILKLGPRRGDAAPMAVIELVQ